VILVLQATLSAPPSSVHCFRDISLYASVFRQFEVVTSCTDDSKDLYWKWLKKHGAMDFIKDIVPEDISIGFKIGDSIKSNFKIPRLDESYLNTTIGTINELQTL